MIPEGWSEARLGDLGYTFGGLTGKSGKDFGTGSATFVTFMNVMANVVLSADGVEAVNVEPGEAQNQLRAGDVIFNGSSETPEEVGFGATVPETLEGVYLNSFCFGFRCYPDAALDATFLSYLTRSPVGREVIRPMAQGSTRYNLAKTNLLNGLFPIPPLAEQQAIAEALSDADARVESLDALIAKKRDMKQAAMQQLLTGRTRLPGFTDDWREIRLGDCGTFSKGQGIRKDEVLESGLPCIRYGQIYTDHSDWIRSFTAYISSSTAQASRRLVHGDLLFTGSGETAAEIGKCVAFLGDEEAYAGGDIVIFAPRNLDSKFMGYILNGPLAVQQKARLAQGDAVVHISAASLATLLLSVPSPAEQKAIAQALSDVDAEIDALVAQREKAELVKQGMMQELLSGRVRLA